VESERMVPGFEYPIAKIAPGRYCYRGRYIIETCWDGPRGGRRYVWELGTEDKYHGIVLDGDIGFRTMRQAMAEVDADRGGTDDE
jgi:hypothetical protein